MSNKNDELFTKLEDIEKYKKCQNEYERENAELKNKISELAAKVDNAVTGINMVSSKHKDINVKISFLWHNYIIISYLINS